MKGFKQGELGRELVYKSTQTVTANSNPREKRFLRVETPSESSGYEEEHLIPGISIRKRETAIDDVFKGEDLEDVLGDSKIDLHPGQSSEESDLNLPYIDPEERAEHEYNGFTTQDPEYWE